MKMHSMLRSITLCLLISWLMAKNGDSQTIKLTYSSAYNVLNTGSRQTNTTLSVNTSIESVAGSNYTKKVSINYGIPFAIGWEYITVKANLSSNYASDPGGYY